MTGRVGGAIFFVDCFLGNLISTIDLWNVPET